MFLGTTIVKSNTCLNTKEKGSNLKMESSRIYYGGIFLNKKELKDNKIKNDVELEYYSTRKFNSLNEEDTTYGIEIVKKEYKRSRFFGDSKKLVTKVESKEISLYDKRRKVNVETNSIEDISNNPNTIKEIIDILIRNTVTPSGLHVTMEELIKQGKTE